MLGASGLLVPKIAFAQENQVQNPSFDAWRRDFEAGVEERMKAAHVPGVEVAIISRDTNKHYTAAFGFADLKARRKLTPQTPVHLASVSKLFTASALVQLFERLGLDLKADINDFIDFKVVNPNFPLEKITPFQLITHTSSISDAGYEGLYYEGDAPQSLSSFLKDYLKVGGRKYSRKMFAETKPGTHWDYCNVALALAGYIVERVAKVSFSDYVQSNIFEPLGIWNAHWTLREFAPDTLAIPYDFLGGKYVALPQQGYPEVPAGMLRCSVSDLAKSVHAMLGGKIDGRPILSPKAVAAMLRNQIAPSIVHYQGLGWVEEPIGGQVYIGHSGSDPGASNMVVLAKNKRHAVAVLMNVEGTTKTSAFRSSMTEDLLAGANFAS